MLTRLTPILLSQKRDGASPMPQAVALNTRATRNDNEMAALAAKAVI